MFYIFLNGRKVPSDAFCISAYDRGLTLGHGLFETILANKGSVPLLDYHWKRLIKSVKLLGIQLPFDFNELSAMINDLIQENGLTDVMGGVRLRGRVEEPPKVLILN